MKDVALLSKVAESTVSHVINGTRFVSPEIAQRVQAAMRALNYHGNAHARRLARGHSDFLGLIISDIENPFFAGLIKAFETAAVSHGLEVLLSATNYDRARTEKAFRQMIENKVAGVAVMTSSIDPELGTLLTQNNIPSVFLDGPEPSENLSRIRMNYETGAQAAVAHLRALGHRTFGIIAGPQDKASHRAYRLELDKALRHRGLSPRVIESHNSVQGGEASIHQWLSEGSLPQAILCSNDLTAIGALKAFNQAGLRVPQDVSLIGADDIPFAELVSPTLTTVRIPRILLGELACDILHKTIHKQTLCGEWRLETELIVRESTGPVTLPSVGQPA
jgi:DNA-binding LacI/PurR family transcriptional regulator